MKKETQRLNKVIRQTENAELQNKNAELQSTTEAVEERLTELVETTENQRKPIEQLNDDLTHSRREYQGLEQENDGLMSKLEENNKNHELELLRALIEEWKMFDT